MINKRNLLYVLFSVFLFSSCVESGNKESIVGDWNGVEWLVNDNPSESEVADVHFSFSKLGGYTTDFGNGKEKGTYILRNNKLFTTPDDQLEIMVLISKLTKDSLVIDMNRSGEVEKLTLIRK